MRHFAFLLFIFFLTGCSGNNARFDKEYYEMATQISFPENYTVLETFDNGEFLTGTVFQLDSLTLLQFVNENHFDTLNTFMDVHMLSENYLVENKPHFTATHNMYYIKRSDSTINWTYLADLKSKRLWAEISYPDWGGK